MGAPTTPDEQQRQISKTVRCLMQVADQNIGDVAAGIGQTHQTVSRKLNTRRIWSVADLYALANHFRVSAPDILAGPAAALEAVTPERHRTTDAA